MSDDPIDLTELEAQLPPWTRELLAVLTPAERRAIVLRESGFTFEAAGEHLGVTGASIRAHVVAGTNKMTEAARRAALWREYAVGVVPHQPPSSCTAEWCKVPELSRKALDLPVGGGIYMNWRAVKCFRELGIDYIGQLVQHREHELLEHRNLGRATLRDVRESLAGLGLHLGMDVGDWKPPAGEPAG